MVKPKGPWPRVAHADMEGELPLEPERVSAICVSAAKAASEEVAKFLPDATPIGTVREIERRCFSEMRGVLARHLREYEEEPVAPEVREEGRE